MECFRFESRPGRLNYGMFPVLSLGRDVLTMEGLRFESRRGHLS
jgi:hypothetical protein